MSFGFFMSPFDGFSSVWGHDCHSPWTYSPRFCSVHGKPFGTTSGFRGGHGRKARARQNTQFEAPMSRRVHSERQKMTPCEPDEQPSENEERREETTQFEAPMSRKVDSEREDMTPCEPEERPSGIEETYEEAEEKVVESEMEKETVKSQEESCATASQETLDVPRTNVNIFATQNAKENFEPAVEPDTHEPEVEKKLQVIQVQLTKAREFVPRLQAFSGIVKERLYLEEHLTRCILELDKVEANGSDVVKSNRKAAIREIESLLGDLDRKC